MGDLRTASVVADSTQRLLPLSLPMTLRFRSRIEINRINPYVLVRADQAARLKSNWRRPMPVRVKVNGDLALLRRPEICRGSGTECSQSPPRACGRQSALHGERVE